MIPFCIQLYGPHGGPLDSSFEAAAERLMGIESLYFEPDGSFVWTCRRSGEQVDGMLYDAGGRLQYVELSGQCGRSAWRQLLVALFGKSEDSRQLKVVNLPDRRVQSLQAFEQTTISGPAS